MIPRTTPVPNGLLDRWLPTLRDTELRVLLVVCRATCGFRAGPEAGMRARKRRDWLSHRQLVARTGRASAAVSRAVEALARNGLLVVEDAAGNPLMTAAERRRHLGQLYYRIGAGAGAGAGVNSAPAATG